MIIVEMKRINSDSMLEMHFFLCLQVHNKSTTSLCDAWICDAWMSDDDLSIERTHAFNKQ